MKCKLCKKIRNFEEMSRHHRFPKRDEGAKGRGVTIICIYCHRILHTAEIQGLCILPKEEEKQ